jgi:hypothetical protein
MLAVVRRKLLGAGLYQFPGTNYGFNPSHPLAAGTTFSAIAQQNSFVRLDRAAVGSVQGSPVGVTDGAIGNAVQFSASTQGVNFSNMPNPARTTATIAAIVILTSVASSQIILIESSTAAGMMLSTVAARFQMSISGLTNLQFGPTLVANIPYFVIASGIWTVNGAGGWTLNSVVTQLNTGQSIAGTASNNPGGVATAGNGTYQVGNRALAITGASKIAAVSFSGNLFSLQQLMSVQYNPWSFWYPQ